jgi:hypothetical protein
VRGTQRVGFLKDAFGIVGGYSAPSAPASVRRVREPCGEAHALRDRPTRGSPTRALHPSVGANRSLHHALHRCLSSQRKIFQVDIEEGEVNFRVQGKPTARKATNKLEIAQRPRCLETAEPVATRKHHARACRYFKARVVNHKRAYCKLAIAACLHGVAPIDPGCMPA